MNICECCEKPIKGQTVWTEDDVTLCVSCASALWPKEAKRVGLILVAQCQHEDEPCQDSPAWKCKMCGRIITVESLQPRDPNAEEVSDASH